MQVKQKFITYKIKAFKKFRAHEKIVTVAVSDDHQTYGKTLLPQSQWQKSAVFKAIQTLG